MTDPVYLTAQQAADLLQVSTRTLRRMATADPTLPCLRVSSQVVRFPKDRLLRWLERRERGRSTHDSAQSAVKVGSAVDGASS